MAYHSITTNPFPMQEPKKSTSLERKVEAYPNPKYHTLVVNYAKDQDVSRSEVVGDALRLYFDSMPKDKIERLLKS